MKKINQSIIAEKLGVSRQLVSKMFSGDRSITAETYEKILDKCPEIADCFEPAKYKINHQKYEKLKIITKLKAKQKELAELEEQLEEEGA